MLIGVFDSGIGGLTVLRALHEQWPGHSTLYLGDTARVPYGTKSSQTVMRYAQQNVQHLLERGVELIVVACNTASAYALPELGDHAPVPVIGVIEPGAEEAVEASRSGHIAVIGTAATVGSGAYERAIIRRRPDARVSARACPLLVPLADEGLERTSIAYAAAERYLDPWLPGRHDRPDALVLGCTHYPVFKPLLRDLLGDDVALIDSAGATARALRPWLEVASAEPTPRHAIAVTDGAEGFRTTAARLLGRSHVALEVVDIQPMVQT